MRALRRGLALVVGGVVAFALALFLLAAIRSRPQDWPWTPLDLAAPVGAATGRKLAALSSDFRAAGRCCGEPGWR